jgi:hypothetical protein
MDGKESEPEFSGVVGAAKRRSVMGRFWLVFINGGKFIRSECNDGLAGSVGLVTSEASALG